MTEVSPCMLWISTFHYFGGSRYQVEWERIGTVQEFRSASIRSQWAICSWAITWYKNRHTGEQMTHWDMLKKATKSEFSLFNMSQCVICSPVWRFCTTWFLSCKRPILQLVTKTYFYRDRHLSHWHFTIFYFLLWQKANARHVSILNLSWW